MGHRRPGTLQSGDDRARIGGGAAIGCPGFDRGDPHGLVRHAMDANHDDMVAVSQLMDAAKVDGLEIADDGVGFVFGQGGLEFLQGTGHSDRW